MHHKQFLDEARGIAALSRQPRQEQVILDRIVRLADQLQGSLPANAEALQQLPAWQDPAVANADFMNWTSACYSRNDQVGAAIGETLVQIVSYFVLVPPTSTIPTAAQLANIGAAASTPQGAIQMAAQYIFAFVDDQQNNRQVYEQRAIIAAAILPFVRQIFASLLSHWGALSGSQAAAPAYIGPQPVQTPQGWVYPPRNTAYPLGSPSNPVVAPSKGAAAF